MRSRLAADEATLDDQTWEKIVAYLQACGEHPANINELEQILRNPSGEIARAFQSEVASGKSTGGGSSQSKAQALAETRDVMSAQDCLACDSAPAVYYQALRRMGVSTAGLTNGAYRDAFLANRNRRRASGSALLAADSAAERRLEERFPGMARINTASPGRAW